MGRPARRRRAVPVPGGRASGAARLSWRPLLLPPALAGLALAGLALSRRGRPKGVSSASTGAFVLAAAQRPRGPVQVPGQGQANAQAANAALELALQAQGATATLDQSQSFGNIIIPDLLVVAPDGLTRQQEAKLAAIAGVRNMISFDGAQIKVDGHDVSVIGVDPATFRSWAPVRTAAEQPFWTALARGQFVGADSVGQSLGLVTGASYRVAGATTEVLRYGGSASLGLAGVDLLVNQARSRRIGLVHQVAALISAPGVNMAKLTAAVSAILGPTAKMESLRSQQLPARPAAGSPATKAPATSAGLPTTYLQLFQESAARYCPGLSWTVLAAIGQIESGDGRNDGPSSAGALGPMQFEPATWSVWGIDGFGQAGPPDIMNPYDAVPSAARMLCADGAVKGGAALSAAIFDYNHAAWYVREVLQLAAAYAADFPG